MAESNVTGPTREDVERRAYEIYLERGGSDGDEILDWLQAEQEVNEEYAAAKAAASPVPMNGKMASTATAGG
jgi:hypothetical protein